MKKPLWLRLLPYLVFLSVFLIHATWLSHQAAAPADGWADVGVGKGGLESYIEAKDHYIGFSYALSASFAAWAVAAFLRVRQTAMAAGAAGGVTLIGVLLGAGCFLSGCCGSPMLGVYAALFGARALGIGKPLMASVTALSVAASYWYLSRRLSRGDCGDSRCDCRGAAE